MIRSIMLLGGAAALTLASPSYAQETAAPAGMQPADGDLAKFAPRPSGSQTSFEYSFLDDALQFMVLRMWPSTRDGARRPDPTTGSRLSWGHQSRYRLEGNRIVFSMLKENEITPLTDYRRDLERLGTEYDIASLSRNEQLAFWMNLHNVTVIEQLATNYPVRSPSRLKVGTENLPLDRAKILNVAGVPLSLHDIRTKIVFPNWNDPDVIYGFFRGEVGGPSIQRRAFTSENLRDVLTNSAQEFVNSLRGVESLSGGLEVSKIYEEAAPFYFPQMGDDLRTHLGKHAAQEVSDLLDSGRPIAINTYEDTIADLTAGENEPHYVPIIDESKQFEGSGQWLGTRISPSVARLLRERDAKLEKLIRDGELRGRVIVLTPGTEGSASEEREPAEVE